MFDADATRFAARGARLPLLEAPGREPAVEGSRQGSGQTQGGTLTVETHAKKHPACLQCAM
eukprot:9490621-Pyramimonas_sp.AAC.1